MFGGEKGKDLLPFIQEMIAADRDVSPEDLEPDICVAAECIIRLFNQVAEWRTAGGFGPNPLSLNDILSYCGVNGFMINSFELQCLKLVDSAFLSNYKSGS